MAKKKSNATPKQQSEKLSTQEDRQSEKLRQEDRAERAAAEEKLQNLKLLNEVLVKQAHKLRVERSSLISANGDLALENARIEADKADAAAASWLEKEVVAVVVGEMRRCGLALAAVHEGIRNKLERKVEELGEYSLDADNERNALKAEVEARAAEAAALRSELSVVLNRESEFVQVLQQLQKENEAAVRAKMESEAAVENLEKEKDSLNVSVAVSLKCSKDLKQEIASLSREKRVMELEKNEKLACIVKLEKEVISLRDYAQVLQTKMNRLQDTVSELQTSNKELSQQRDGLAVELANLKERSEEGEHRIRNLLSEKDMLAQNIAVSARCLTETMGEAEKAKAWLQTEIAELREAHKTQVDEMQVMTCELKTKLEQTQQSCETHVEDKKKLLTKLERLKIESEALVADKARVQEEIQLEKKNVESLTRNLAELEMRMEEKVKEIRRLGNEKSEMMEAKEAAEAQVELLMKEKDLVRRRMEVAEEDLNKARANSDTMLRVLKKTTAQLHASADCSGGDEELHMEGGVNSFVHEMEAIKNAFKSREATMAEMRKQLETMKHSVGEAHKGRSLWKLVSTATTIFAAASVAYVSRGH